MSVGMYRVCSLLFAQEGRDCLHHAVCGGNLTLVNELITRHGCDPRRQSLVGDRLCVCVCSCECVV